MADVREELALGPAGLFGGIPGLAHRLGLLERLLDAFLFSDVPADAQKPLLAVFDNLGDQQEFADLRSPVRLRIRSSKRGNTSPCIACSW